MTLNFCTLFDSNYLDRGLVLYESLERTCEDFVLYIVAMDEQCYDALNCLNLQFAEIIYIEELIYDELLIARNNRSHRAFCWTCSSWSLKYVFEKYMPEICTYIDADEFFYNSPEELIMDFAKSDCNVAIIGHHFGDRRYAERMERNSGSYCVQFNSFKNNSQGLGILEDWCRDCAQECTDYHKNNKFGDQRYLDDWTEKYDGIYIYDQIGAGVAPWNFYRYRSINGKYQDEKNYLYDIVTKKNIKLYFIHYHSLFIYDDYADISVFTRCGKHDKTLIYSFYNEYIGKLIVARKTIKEKIPKLKTNSYDIKNNKQTNRIKAMTERIKSMGILNYVSSTVKYRVCKKYDYIKIET